MSNFRPVYWVKKGDSLWKIAARLYPMANNGGLVKKVDELKRLNPHLKKPDLIHPGQVIYLGNGTPTGESGVFATDLSEMERCLAGLSPCDQEFYIDNFETLSVLGQEFDTPTFLNEVSVGPNTIASQSNGTLTTTSSTFNVIAKHAFSGLKNGIKTGAEMSKGKFGNFIKVSPYAWDQVHGDLVRGLNTKVRYVREANGALRLVPSHSRAMSTLGKVIVVNPTSSGYQTFSKTAIDAKKTMTTLKDGAKYLGYGVDLSVAAYNIGQKWDTPQRDQTIVKETVRTSTSIGLGVFGGSVAGGVCGLLTLTAGPAGVACYFTVLIAYGVGVGVASTAAGSSAEVYYESKIAKPVGANP